MSFTYIDNGVVAGTLHFMYMSTTIIVNGFRFMLLLKKTLSWSLFTSRVALFLQCKINKNNRKWVEQYWSSSWRIFCKGADWQLVARGDESVTARNWTHSHSLRWQSPTTLTSRIYPYIWIYLTCIFRSPESLRWPIAMGWRPSSCVVRRASWVVRRALTFSYQELQGQS